MPTLVWGQIKQMLTLDFLERTVVSFDNMKYKLSRAQNFNARKRKVVANDFKITSTS